MNGLFITGTDTGVGKTWIATHLARALTQNGLRVVPRKPVESDCARQGNDLIPADALALKNAADYAGTLQQICPYPFEPAISPARAAQLSNKILRISDLKAACINDVNENDFLLVEGAGGFYSPMCSDGLNADLAQALNLPIILVADDRVGCINHVLMTLEAAHKRDIQVSCIILNRKTPAPAEMDNLKELTNYVSHAIFPCPEKCDDFITHILSASLKIRLK